MTRERLNELVRQSTSQEHLDYLLGRETAIEKVSSGMADQYINHQGLCIISALTGFVVSSNTSTLGGSSMNNIQGCDSRRIAKINESRRREEIKDILFSLIFSIAALTGIFVLLVALGK